MTGDGHVALLKSDADCWRFSARQGVSSEWMKVEVTVFSLAADPLLRG